MSPFDRAIQFILTEEGGFVDDPRDSGGKTRFGISQASYPDIDIKNLTEKDATDIYRRDYWNRCHCNELPSPLAIILFDSAVNQGPAAAIRLFQKSLGVRVDGQIGPLTIAAAHQCKLHEVVPEFIARRAFQYALHKQLNVYGLGWFRRLSRCHQTAMEPL